MNQPAGGGFCEACGSPRKFHPAYTKRDGTHISASWRCPQGRACVGKPIWLKDQPQQAQQPPAANYGPPPQGQYPPQGYAPPAAVPPQPQTVYTPRPAFDDVRERSIAAQACAKAACDAAGSIAPAMTQEAAGWIVALADALFQQVVRQAQGLPSGPVTPQGHPNAPSYQQDPDIPF